VLAEGEKPVKLLRKAVIFPSPVDGSPVSWNPEIAMQGAPRLGF